MYYNAFRFAIFGRLRLTVKLFIRIIIEKTEKKNGKCEPYKPQRGGIFFFFFSIERVSNDKLW